MSLKVFLPSLLVLALSACAVGPDYKTPATEAANITYRHRRRRRAKELRPFEIRRHLVAAIR